MSLTQEGSTPRQVLTFDISQCNGDHNNRLTIDYSSDLTTLNYVTIQPFLKAELESKRPVQKSLLSIYTRLKTVLRPKRLKVKCTQTLGELVTTVQLSYKKAKKKKTREEAKEKVQKTADRHQEDEVESDTMTDDHHEHRLSFQNDNRPVSFQKKRRLDQVE